MEQLIEITVSEDSLEAYMTLRKQGRDDNKPSLTDLNKVVEEEGISHGLITGSLEKVLVAPSDSKILIARGTKPQKSAPSYFKVKKRLYESRPPQESGGQIDFKMVSPFIMVKGGEPLAKRIEAFPGEKGIDVKGNDIPPTKKEIELLQPGENTVEKDGVVYAVKAGRFELENRIFRINEVLEIAGDVDYSTGHISFPGDVIIQGQIKDGFRVAAGGSIHCKNTLDASEVLTKKDLIIEGGIIGRKTGQIRVQGKVETKFIEHCHVESQGSIAVKSSIVDSEIYTLGELVLLKNGRLIGGTVYAEKGITLQDVGSPSAGQIEIFLGISYVQSRRLQYQQQLMHDLGQKKKKVKALQNRTKKEELLRRVEDAQEKIQEQLAKQIGSQYTFFEAKLNVHGDIYPGAVITICDRSLSITEKLSHTTFYYDESQQKIVQGTL